MRYYAFDQAAAVRPSRRMVAGFVVAALLIAELSLSVHPTGFAGGPSDDQRYLDAALAWWRSGPSAGTTHWALRVPLIAAIDAMFRLAGPSLAALLTVPRLFYALFVASAAGAMVRWAGMRAAWVWLALVVTSPVLHEMATSCFPEIVELAFGTLSLVAFAAGRQAVGWRRAGWMALAGLALGLAVLVRETAAFLALGYLWLAARRPAGPRAAYLALAGGLLLPPLADVTWLWWLSGDWLYRLHVDANHIHIYSAHLKGGVFRGGPPFLNLALARLWIPAGPTRVHWALNPIGDFLIDPAFGFVILACLLLAIPAVRGRHRLPLPPGMVPAMLAIGIGCYVTVTWVFTLRPQPRYYLPVAAAAAQIGLAVALAAMLARAETRRRARLLLAPVLAAGAVTILMTRDAGWQAKTAVPYMAAHPGIYAAEPNIAGRIAYRATVAGAAPAIIGTPPVGGYRITEAGSRDWQAAGGMRPQPGYRDVALLPVRQSALYALLHPNYWRAMRIEQRVR